MTGGAPTALAAVAVEADSAAAMERLLYGDSLGGILMLGPRVGQRLLPAQELAMGRDFEVVNAGHTGWVTQVSCCSPLCLMDHRVSFFIACKCPGALYAC